MELVIPLTLDIFSHILARRGLLLPFSPVLQPLLSPGDKLLLEMHCLPGYVYIVSGVKIICRPTENIIISFGFDGNTIIPSFTCGELFSEAIDFKRYGFPWVVQDKIYVYLENTRTEDTRVEMVLFGAYIRQDIYNLMQQKYAEVIFRWLKSRS